jgi:hypothetical protein
MSADQLTSVVAGQSVVKSPRRDPICRCAVQPPSTTKFVPVINEAAGDAANTTAAATSSGCPTRPAGARSRTHCASSGFASVMRRYIGVSTKVGATETWHHSHVVSTHYVR